MWQWTIIFQYVRIKAFQWLPVQINHLQRSIRCLRHAKCNVVYGTCSILSCYSDACCSVQSALNNTYRLIFITFIYCNLWQLCRSNRQRIGIICYIWSEICQWFTANINHIQCRYLRQSGSHINLILCCIDAIASGHFHARNAVQSTLGYFHRLGRFTLNIGHFGQFGRTYRQIYVVGQILRFEVANQVIAHLQVFQHRIGRCLQFEGQFVGLWCWITWCRDIDLIYSAVYHAWCIVCNCLCSSWICGYSLHLWHRGCRCWQRYAISRLVRGEACQTLAIDLNILQGVI